MEPQTNRTPQQNPQTMPGMNQQQDSRTPGNPYGVTTNKFWDFIPATGDKPPELLLYRRNKQPAVMVGRQGDATAIQSRTCGAW